MSVEAITYVWQTAQEQSTRMLMLLALADFANELGECWPGIEALAQKVRVKVRNAQTILKKLQENGAIKIEYNNGVTTKTGQETTQPNRDDLAYWATGVEDVYLEGALRRIERGEAPTDVRPDA